MKENRTPALKAFLNKKMSSLADIQPSENRKMRSLADIRPSKTPRSGVKRRRSEL